jgi:hypothetical protein
MRKLLVALAVAGTTILTPAVASAATGLATLVSSSSYLDSVGYEHVVGEVKNVSAGNIEFIKINLDELDSSGTLLGTDFTYAQLDKMKSNEKSPFDVLFEPPMGYDHYRISSVTADATSSGVNHNFTVQQTNDYVDSAGYRHLVGTATNNNTTTAQFVQIIATMYDASGIVRDTDFTYVNTDDNSSLAPGQTASWEILHDAARPFSSVALIAESSTAPTSNGGSGAGSGQPPDVTSLHVPDVHVASGSCRYVPMSAVVTNGGSVNDVDVQIWRGSSYLDDRDLSMTSATVASGSYFYCPNIDGLGAFRAGPSQIAWDNGAAQQTKADATTATFRVKQAATAKIATDRSGRTVTITGRLRYYRVSASGFVYAKKTILYLQKLSSGTWRTVDHASTGKHAKAVFEVTSKKARSWRIVFHGSKTIWASVSNSARE